jgi:haloalkane dehalogenase
VADQSRPATRKHRDQLSEGSGGGRPARLRTPEERFEDLPGFGFTPRYVELADGLRMHHIDEGPGGGPVVLLLHGQPTWSYLYRTVIPVLAEAGCRVVAPDLIGFGRSDKPVRRTDHTVRTHIGWLEQFLDALSLRDITLVAQDWGGPFGLGVLARAPERFSRVVATNTVLHSADESLAGQLEWSCHARSDGTVVVEQALLDYQRMTQELHPMAPSLFVQGATMRELSPSEEAAYDAPFPDERFCAGPRQLPLLMGLTPASACARQNQRTVRVLKTFARPLLTAFSNGDPSTRGWEAFFQGRVPGAANQPHIQIDGAGHFLQEDKGEQLAEAIARWMAGTPL